MLDIKKLRKKIKEKEQYLAVLEEYDRTGKLHKVSYKERANFTIDVNLLSKFKKYCGKNSISMSNKIESFIKQYLAQLKEE